MGVADFVNTEVKQLLTDLIIRTSGRLKLTKFGSLIKRVLMKMVIEGKVLLLPVKKMNLSSKGSNQRERTFVCRRIM